MGTVYRARDPILDRLVALKTVAPALLARKDTLVRFQREARAAARLQHPNIVTVYELGEVGGTLFIAMELLEGMDLAEAMQPPDRLSLAERVRIMIDVCRGLDYAHKCGIVHRDIKPANIRVRPDGSVKIVDFGIARLADSSVTQTGLILGTPTYMAPEVLKEGRVDHRADMWAVGVILYEMLAGKRPYDGPTIAGLVYRIVHEPLPALRSAPGAPAELATIVAKALSKEPAARYQDLAEMAQALERAMGFGQGGEAPLSAEARRRESQRYLAEARQLRGRNDLERALEAAQRARSLEPSDQEVVVLVDEIEERLSDAATVATHRQPSAADLTLEPLPDAPATRVARSASAATPAATPATPRAAAPATPAAAAEPASAPPKPLPTPVLTELRLRGAAVFRELATFGEPPATKAARLSPVGDVLAIAGADGAIRMWDLHSRSKIQTLRTELHRRTGHDAVAVTVAFSGGGSLLASGHVDGAVHLWDATSGEEVPIKLRHEASVATLAFSPDGTVLASGGLDSNLKLWSVPAALAGEARRELLRQPSGVTALTYAGDGALLVTGHQNRIVRLLDATTCRLIATLRGPEATVSLVCPAPDGRRLAVASQDRTIRLFDLEQRCQLFVVGGHRKPTTSLSFFSDGTHLATVAQDNAVHLWDLESRAPVAALWGIADESFASVALFGAGDHIAVALADGRIRVWGPAS